MDSKIKVYGIYDPKTNVLKYVGVTSRCVETRLLEHMRKPTNHKMRSWVESLINEGLKPYIKIINTCDTYNEALTLETKYIKNTDGLLNVLVDNIKNYMLGKTHTEESRRKISTKLSGRKISEEELFRRRERLVRLWSDEEWASPIREKMSDRMMGNTHARGFTHTEEFKEKKRCEMLGNTHSKGLKHTDEYKKYMSEINKGENNPNYGKKTSKHILKERSRKVKEMGTFKGENNPNFKYVIEECDLREYVKDGLSVKDISEKYGCTPPVIRKKLKQYSIDIPKKPKKYNLDIQEILMYRDKGLTQKEIGVIYGCSNKVISKYIRKHDK